MIATGQIAMVYQPVVDLTGPDVIGYEALARFPDAPEYPVSRWFSDAETAGFAVSLEIAAIRQGLEALSILECDEWLALNASPQTLCSPALGALLGERDMTRVVLELTEHAHIADYRQLRRTLAPLRGCGVRIAIDDVGAGYASFQHILELRPDIIKLDQGMVRGLHADSLKQALVRALGTFAADIGAVMIAEGVETVAELETLAELGMTHVQGYHVGAPGPLRERMLSAALV